VTTQGWPRREVYPRDIFARRSAESNLVVDLVDTPEIAMRLLADSVVFREKNILYYVKHTDYIQE
jgi:hypothetical protein